MALLYFRSQCIPYQGDYHHSSRIQPSKTQSETTTESAEPQQIKVPKSKPTTPKPLITSNENVSNAPTTTFAYGNKCGYTIYEGSGNLEIPGFPGVW